MSQQGPMCIKAQRLESICSFSKSVYTGSLLDVRSQLEASRARASAQAADGQERGCFSHHPMPKFNTYFYERKSEILYSFTIEEQNFE